MLRTLALLLLAIYTGAASATYKLETIAEGFDHPWCVAFLPNGDFLLSMRTGELRRVSAAGDVGESLKGVPATYVKSQGGFFDIALDPQFTSNSTVYLAFAFGTANDNATRVVRARLTDDGIEDVSPIFTVSTSKDTPAHYGGKLQFLNDGSLLVTTGDGFDYREAAQDTFSQLGKLIRINTDGSVPADNPFADGKSGDPKVWSYGHRNPQGLSYNPATGTVYLHEHGPRGGDEVNIIAAGANYGWPAVTYGINYSGAYVSPFQKAPGFKQPLKYWVPSIAPSGLAYYSGDKFPEWSNSLFVGALIDKEVRRLSLQGDQITAEEALFSELGERIRDVRVGPDGFIYLLTDSDAGKLVRVVPEPPP